MFECTNCNSKEMIYLGKGKHPISMFIGSYNYLCKECNTISWSYPKSKSKYKWYKEKEFLKKYFKELEGKE